MGDPRIVVVTQRTRLEELVQRFGTVGQAKFYVESLHESFDDYVSESDRYQRGRDALVRVLQDTLPMAMVNRELVPLFGFRKEDLIYVYGRDGLVANCMKYLDGQPVVGINPDPERWTGTLLPWRVSDITVTHPQRLLRSDDVRAVTMAMVRLTDGQRLYAVNDLFVGRRTHASSRYTLQFGERSERQSSSGVIISTGVGSSAWLSSVVAGAVGIARSYFAEDLPPRIDPRFSWDARRLVFSVREPYESPVSGTELVFGAIQENQTVEIVSEMADGVIFGDGVEEDALVFGTGMRATIGIADRTGFLATPPGIGQKSEKASLSG